MLAVSLSSGLVNTYIRVKCIVEEVVRYESWGVNCMFQDRKTAGSQEEEANYARRRCLPLCHVGGCHWSLQSLVG